MYRITERETGCVIRQTRDLFVVGRYARHADRYTVKGV